MRAKEKAITVNRVATEAGAETRVRVKARAEFRDRYVGILPDVLNKVRSAYNRLKRAMVGYEEDTKEKAGKSRTEEEAEEMAEKAEDEPPLQYMILAEVHYWKSWVMAMIEE